MTETEDDPLASLIARVALGDRRAFDELYRESAPRLYAVCLRVAPSAAEAQEALQEAFLKLWHKADSFSPERAAAAAWMAAIARNAAIDLRRRRRESTVVDEEASARIPDPDRSPEDLASLTSDVRRLHECLAVLDQRASDLIRTAYFEGISYRELAERDDQPLGSVKTWIRRGLKALRRCLEEWPHRSDRGGHDG